MELSKDALDPHSPEYQEKISSHIELIRQNIKLRRADRCRDEARNGFVQVVKGGSTYALGNKLTEKQFHKTLGYGWPPKPSTP